MVKLQGCCCCFSLKTGTILIGIMQALAGFSMIVRESQQANDPGFDDDWKDEDRFEARAPANDHRNLSITAAVLGAFHLVLSILLVIGAIQEEPKLIKPWIIFTIISSILAFLVFIGVVIVLFMLDLGSVGLILFMFLVPSALLTAYFHLVVYSFYSDLICPVQTTYDV